MAEVSSRRSAGAAVVPLQPDDLKRSPVSAGLVVEPQPGHEPSVPIASPTAREWLWRAERLDLTDVRQRVSNSNPKWSDRQLFDAERGYVRFLALVGLFPDRSITPTSQMDEFWHQHLLDTRKYRADCETLLGRFLDHVPGQEAADEGDDVLQLIYEHLRGPSDPRCNFYGLSWRLSRHGDRYEYVLCGVPLSAHADYENNHPFSEDVYHQPPPRPGGRSRSCASSQRW